MTALGDHHVIGTPTLSFLAADSALGIPDANTKQQSFSKSREAFPKSAEHSFVPGEPEDSTMLALKFIAVVLGAGTLVAMYSGDFGPELLLAIVFCLS